MIVTKTDDSFFPPTNHYVLQFFDQLNPGTVFFIVSFGLFIVAVIMKVYEMVKGKALFSGILVNDVKDMILF